MTSFSPIIPSYDLDKNKQYTVGCTGVFVAARSMQTDYQRFLAFYKFYIRQIKLRMLDWRQNDRMCNFMPNCCVCKRYYQTNV